jgi:hypothetical protein
MGPWFMNSPESDPDHDADPDRYAGNFARLSQVDGTPCRPGSRTMSPARKNSSGQAEQRKQNKMLDAAAYSLIASRFDQLPLG